MSSSNRAADPKIAERLRKLFQDTDQMNRLMDRLYGRDRWVFDPVEDVWITPNKKGPGVVVVRRGGDWFVREAAS